MSRDLPCVLKVRKPGRQGKGGDGMRLSDIYKINIDLKDGNKADIDIPYRNGKSRTIKSFEAHQTSFGLTLKKKDTAPGGCQGCIIGSLKRFFSQKKS